VECRELETQPEEHTQTQEEQKTMNNSIAESPAEIDQKPVDELALTHRIALVVNPSLDRGAAGNRCAVLATGLAARHPEIIGPDLVTADGVPLPGFTKVPMAVLVGKSEPLGELARRARELGCTTLVFLARAQGTRSYEAYRESVAQTQASNLDVDAFAIFGPKKAVNSVVGALPCLR
jgi:hypothetical protein